MDLVFDRVTKLYGPVIGINDVSFRIGPGITGLLGSNGAGKSTLLKLASGQLRPSLGRVLLGEHPTWSSAAKRAFGYSPDLDRFYEDMTAYRFVYSMARLYGYRAVEADRRTLRVLEEVGMGDRANRRMAGCSHGMRQRVKLAQALVHDPEVLLLDEPLNGVDPGGRRHLNELLVRLARQGKTILVSSHILVEVQHLADQVLVISRGRIMASGTLAEIRSLLDDQPFTVQIVARPARDLAALLVRLGEVTSVDVRDEALIVKTRNPTRFFAHLGELVLEHGLAIDRFETIDSSADAVFDYLQRA